MAADSDTPAQTELSGHDQARLHRVFGRMPFAAGLSPASFTDITVDSVVSTLEQLADRLSVHVEETRERDAELMRYRALIAGGRQLVEVLLGSNEPIKGRQT